MDHDLEEYLDSIDDDTLSDLQTIGTNDQAASALRSIARLEDKVAAHKQQATRAKANIDLWETSVSAPILERIKILRAELEAFALERRKANPHEKTHATPYGVIKTRAKAPEWVIDAEDDLIHWALEHDPDLVKLTTSLRKDVLKRTYRNVNGTAVNPLTGEIAPGVHIEQPAEPTITIHPSL